MMQQTNSTTRIQSDSYLKTPTAGVKAALWLALIGTLLPLVCLAIPMYVIRPFRPQDPSQLAIALTVRNLAPWVSALCAVIVLITLFAVWKRTKRVLTRTAFVVLALVAVVAAGGTHINIFEIMFHPYEQPTFADARSVKIDADDKVLAVQINGVSHAYPIRIMGYHHIVNDVLGETPIAATYCTLCHTGLIWSRLLDGQTLHFRLAGINNGNALMRDEETSTIWQQSTGQAIFGAMKGKQLTLVHSDEITFALWSKENPNGLVLKPDAPYAPEYEAKDWEKHIEQTRTVIDTRKSGIAPHELMLGITLQDRSKAYPVKAILAAGLIQDQIDGIPVLILVGPDHASIRAFQAQAGNQQLTFMLSSTGKDSIAQDAETSSLWDFRGCAIEGKLAQQCLTPLDANKDYWFDWMNHHPKTAVFKN